MGCGNSKISKLLDVDVSKVPKIPENEVEKFKTENISNIYIHEGDSEFEDRKKNSCNYMFSRWEWLQNNISTYVNMLRSVGYLDDQIQACLDGIRPVSFTEKKIHVEYINNLKILKDQIEKEDKTLTKVEFIQTGSSVVGFSTNPWKGFKDRPSKLTDPASSDTDVVICAKGMKDFIKKFKDQQVKIRDYPCVTTKTGGSDERYGFKDMEHHPLKAVSEFYIKWNKKLPAGIQITFQEEGAIIPPWEIRIKTSLYDA